MEYEDEVQQREKKIWVEESEMEEYIEKIPIIK